MSVYLLRLSFVGSLVLVIDATKIGYDHRNRKCYDQDAAERTNSAHHLADDCSRNHVSIAVQHTDRPTAWLRFCYSDVPAN